MKTTSTRRTRLAPCTPRIDRNMPRDSRGDWCVCGLPIRHERHQAPVTPVDLAAMEARRYGDREDDA